MPPITININIVRNYALYRAKVRGGEVRWLREFMELPVYLRAMLIVDLMCNFGIGLVMPIELLFTVAHDYRAAVAGAFVSGLGMGMQTSWASILTQISTRKQHRIVYGINQAELNLGIGLGAAVGGLLAAGGQDFLYRLGFGGRALGFALLSLSLLVIERHWQLRRLTAELKAKAEQEVVQESVQSTNALQANRSDSTESKTVNGTFGGRTSSLTRVLASMILLTLGTFFMDLFGYSQFDAGLVTTLISDPHIPRWSLSVVDVVNTFSVVIMNIVLLPRLKDANHVRLLRTVPVFWAAAWMIIVLGLRLDSTLGALSVASLGITIFGLGEVMMGISQAASLGYIVGPMFASYILAGHEVIPFLAMCAIGLVLLAVPWFLAIPSRQITSQKSPAALYP